MTKLNLIIEAENLQREYISECATNGNCEGSTQSFALRCKLDCIADLLQKYYQYEFKYERLV